MSKIRVDEIVDEAGTGKPDFPHGFQLEGADFEAGGGGSLEFVATGDIPNGATVGITADGTIAEVTPFLGSPQTWETERVEYSTSVYDTNSNKLVVFYPDWDNGTQIYGIVGTVSGDTISFGTRVLIQSNSSYYTSAVFDPNTNKIVVAYYSNTAAILRANVVEVSGDTLSVGSHVDVYSNAYQATTQIKTAIDPSTGKVLLMFTNNAPYNKVAVGTISGSSISWGSFQEFNSLSTYTDAYHSDLAFDPTSGQFVLVFRSGHNQYTYARTATISGTSVTFGTQVLIGSAGYENAQSPSVAIDETLNKVVIIYDNHTASRIAVVAGTISGTNLSFGTPQNLGVDGGNRTVYYDSNNNKTFGFYTFGNVGYQVEITVGSGDSVSISVDSKIIEGSLFYNSFVNDPDSGKTIVSGKNTTTEGNSIILDNASSIGGYLGIAESAISDGATGSVTITGGKNDSQSGLVPATQYYLQLDGSLSPSVTDNKVGVALSSTSILLT